MSDSEMKLGMSKEYFARTGKELTHDAEINVWLASEITDHAVYAMVDLVSSSIDYDINKARAFCVALLQNVNDHQAAAEINDVLLGIE